MKKTFIWIIVLIIIMLIGAIVYKTFWNKGEQKKVEIKDTITEYGYTLEDRDSKIFKESFDEIKNILNKEEIDYNKYAIALSKLFIIDLYTLNNKNNKYDIGSVEYVYSDMVENYKENVRNTMYKYIGDKTIKKEDLPEVKSVTINDVNEVKYKIADKEYDSYNIELSWDYTKESDYDNEGYLIIVKDNDKLFVVEKGYIGV